MKKQEMSQIEYQQKLWKVRGELQFKGIHKPVNLMVKAGIIERDTYKYHNFMSGRVPNKEFLELLIKFNNSLE